MKEMTKTRKLLVNGGIVLLLLALAVRTAGTPGTAGEDYAAPVYGTAWALLPPLVAILLALVTKEVYSALFTGILVGALLYSGGNAELAANTMLYHPDGGLVPALTDLSHAGILVVVTLLASLVVVMNRSGGAYAFGKWAEKHIHSRVGAQLAVVLMGIMIFVDDGFNCLTVGSVMRPITDKYKVSRAKFAYLIDATAAPVCIIAPISCWAAAVTYAVPGEYHINGFQMFLRTIPYNLYALGTLFMLVMVTVLRADYGPMRVHEKNAEKGDLFTSGDRPYDETEQEEVSENGRISNLVIPVAVLIVSCIAFMAYTGGILSGEGLIESFSEADSARALVMGSLFTILVTLWLYWNRGVMKFHVYMESLAAGFRSMCAPMIILILSWNLSGMTSLLGAADFIHGVVEASAGRLEMFVPCVVFLISVFLAFATGTSWGTFTILIPIVCAIFPAESEMLVISISACLSGAVCGDHCSPISDTTIMSSAGARCDHINHVTTQLPYAMTAAAASAAGYLLAGVIGYRTNSAAALAATPVTLILIVCVLIVLRTRERRREGLSPASR